MIIIYKVPLKLQRQPETLKLRLWCLFEHFGLPLTSLIIYARSHMTQLNARTAGDSPFVRCFRHVIKHEMDWSGNYRPLTLLSIPSKISESFIINYLRCVLQRNQRGCGKGLSSESLLLYLTVMWKLSIDDGKVIGAIFN